MFTDSFHGTVFSILLVVRNFFSYVARSNRRASRLETLLSSFGYLDRIIRNDDFSKVDVLLNQGINIEEQKAIVEAESKESRKFLDKYIK